ncbi:MAG: alkaline phosphatase family protein [Cutibacterium avidum]|nr:alkaline phosphatase family protein [Cutibacterium avidum]MDU3283087.1 alkaline phosphatase family protein [Cutibacterium avidum]MDU7717523.1 alkaline phosphatase family protein [Cutibacterium avidum]
MHTPHSRLTRLVSASVAAGMAAFGFVAPIASHAQPENKATPGASSSAKKHTTITSTNVASGKIKHVWLIILENKSYDATFSGLNQNSYLWKELPKQGALLPHYFGTGHYSQDNYTSMVSGQSAEMDLQSDCDVANTSFGSNASIIDRHTGKEFGRDDNYGQVLSLAGPNAADGKNGCTYPKDVPTLFNQFDAAGVTWKGYAQDLRNHSGREDGLAGSPGTLENTPDKNPKAMKPTEEDKAKGITSFTGAQPDDQYVAKHFPFPWFHSIIGNDGTGKDSLTKPTDGGIPSDSKHIANADDPSNGLLADLAKPADEVPAFSWITPNNCSDAHDATCKGNNLSGLFDADGKPDYSKPLSTPPKNHTGGLYAADLWLRYYIPLIEKSDAFKDGGLIDVTFDEANPPFTNMSFNNATDDTDVAKAARKEELYNYSPQTIKDLAEGYKKYDANTFPKPSKMSKNYVKADLAGQNINGENVDWEPTGPNSTLETDEHGNQLFPGPGDNGYITRPPSCEQDTDLVNADKSNCVHGAKNTGAGWGYSKAKTIDVSNTAGTSKLTGKVTVTDLGRKVTGEGIPEGAHVGKVANQGPNMVADPKDDVTNSSFVIVDANDKPLKTTADVTSVTLSATGVPGHLANDESPLATFNAQDATPGGGATGSVLISPYIKPGTVSNTYYNHFSWLRTMEDLFEVSKGNDTRELEAGTVSTGLDGDGHLGFAAQAGLGTFGKDVFNNLPTEPNPSASASASTPASAAPTATATSSTSASASTPTSAAPTATATRSTAPGAAPGDDGNGSRPSLPRTGNGEVSDPAAAESAIAGLVVVGAAVSAWAIRRKRR